MVSLNPKPSKGPKVSCRWSSLTVRGERRDFGEDGVAPSVELLFLEFAIGASNQGMFVKISRKMGGWGGGGGGILNLSGELGGY